MQTGMQACSQEYRQTGRQETNKPKNQKKKNKQKRQKKTIQTGRNTDR
jgi:hypothetical protein